MTNPTYQYKILKVGPINLLDPKCVRGISLLFTSAVDCDENKSLIEKRRKNPKINAGTVFERSAIFIDKNYHHRQQRSENVTQNEILHLSHFEIRSPPFLFLFS